jgi:SNF2 family DNA or RNA helicase
MLRRLKSEVGVEIPPKTVQTIQLEMTAEQAKYYQDMALRYVAEVQETSERITALAEIAVITRLRQILSTPYTVGFPDTSGKLDAAMELIQGTDQQIVVFSMFKGTIEALGNRLTQEEIPFAVITGDIKAEDRDAARHALDAGEIQVLLCTLGAGGVGLNLQAASVAIFIEHHWNPREQKQAEDRIHRLGQKNPVTIYNLMCVNSIDSAVAGVLARKQKMSDDILKEALVAELERFHPGIGQKLEALYAL